MAIDVEFRFGDVFDAAEPVDRWLVSLSLGLNDLVASNVQLMEASEDDSAVPEHERVYLARLVGAQVWEIIKLIKDAGEDPGVSGFLDALPGDAQDQRCQLLDALDDGNFRGTLAGGRDHFFHYPEIGSRKMTRAMKALADVRLGARIGDNLATTRLHYADKVAEELFFPGAEDRLEELRAFLETLSGLVVTLTDFIQRALWAHLEPRRDRIDEQPVAGSGQ